MAGNGRHPRATPMSLRAKHHDQNVPAAPRAATDETSTPRSTRERLLRRLSIPCLIGMSVTLVGCGSAPPTSHSATSTPTPLPTAAPSATGLAAANGGATPTPTPTTLPPGTTPTPSPIVVGSLGTSAKAVAEWMTSYGDIFSTITTETSNIYSTGWALTATTGSYCNQLASTTARAAKYPAIPNAGAQSAFSTMVSDYNTAGTTCALAVSDHSSADMSAAEQDFAAGAAEQSTAASDISAIVG